MAKTKITDEELADYFENDFEPDWDNVRDRSAVAEIEQAVTARRVVENAIEAAVVRARHNGVTWVEIAAALGVTHQGAMKRYRDKV